MGMIGDTRQLLARATIVKVKVDKVAADWATIYDRERSQEMAQSITARTRAAMGDDRVGYFHASFNGQAWILFKRVPDQLWLKHD